MATGNARRFMELGLAGPLARELAAQVTASVGNAQRLRELTLPAAGVFAAAVVSHTLSAAQINGLAQAGVPGPVVREFAAQIAS